MNSFFFSQFSYCPLIWIFHSRTVNINKLYEIYLQVVYNDNSLNSSFKELFETDKSVPIHIKNLQVLATECWRYIEIYLPLSWDNCFNQGTMITIHDSFHSLNYQTEEVFFVEQKIFHFLAQKSGILYLMNLRRKHNYMFSRN